MESASAFYAARAVVEAPFTFPCIRLVSFAGPAPFFGDDFPCPVFGRVAFASNVYRYAALVAADPGHVAFSSGVAILTDRLNGHFLFPNAWVLWPCFFRIGVLCSVVCF